MRMRKLKYPMTKKELNELLAPPEPNETIWPIVCVCILKLAQSIEGIVDDSDNEH